MTSKLLNASFLWCVSWLRLATRHRSAAYCQAACRSKCSNRWKGRRVRQRRRTVLTVVGGRVAGISRELIAENRNRRTFPGNGGIGLYAHRSWLGSSHVHTVAVAPLRSEHLPLPDSKATDDRLRFMAKSSSFSAGRNSCGSQGSPLAPRVSG